MSESSEVIGGGTSALAVAPDALAVSPPIEEGGGGTAPEDSPLGRIEPTLKLAALYLRKVAPMGAIT